MISVLQIQFGHLNQKTSSGEGPGASSMSCGNVSTDCQSNHGTKNMASHHENASSLNEGSIAAKKKRESRLKGGGLRQFSNIVCQKLESKVRTTYNEVADEIVAEFSGARDDAAASSESDEKNIRRRVYDALNVLLALDIIAGDKKEIHWKGLPNTHIKDLEEIKALRLRLVKKIGKKVAYLKGLEEKIVGLQDLLTRNCRLLKCGSASPEGFSLPFILVQTSPHATVEIEISEDMQLVHFDFNSTPFSLHDDAYILELMRYNQQPESTDASQSFSAHSSSSSVTPRGTKPFHWNSETHLK
ncbi:transcription factor-like protein DPA isoform X1 [Carya illinoinensis]|uniref:Transcription factor-like protein DPB n=3 Tax=Carya illinoinensis TaxID=32201 RepID=A0A922E734_CARIL|nr:transcription factor-like protein DPA isoform X1 [Carya illinoinensis]KAG6697317.1 hypothetical protein I3842_09G192900 [Carya illinoinensis]